MIFLRLLPTLRMHVLRTTSNLGIKLCRLLKHAVPLIVLMAAAHSAQAQTRHSDGHLLSFAGHADLLAALDSCQITQTEFSPAECAQAWQIERTLGTDLLRARIMIKQAHVLINASVLASQEQYLQASGRFYSASELAAGFYAPVMPDHGLRPNSTGYQIKVDAPVCNAAERDYDFHGPSYQVRVVCYRKDGTHYLLVGQK